jgi:hypothetical protein
VRRGESGLKGAANGQLVDLCSLSSKLFAGNK